MVTYLDCDERFAFIHSECPHHVFAIPVPFVDDRILEHFHGAILRQHLADVLITFDAIQTKSNVELQVIPVYQSEFDLAFLSGFRIRCGLYVSSAARRRLVDVTK